MAKSQKHISKTAKELSIDKKLDSLLEDRVSGAADIEKRALNLLLEIISVYRNNSHKYLYKVTIKIKKRFSTMANLLNLAVFMENEIENDDFRIIRRSVLQYKREIEDSRNATIMKTAQSIKSYRSIFTLSGSSLIQKAILDGKNRGWKGEVRIIESRPKNEGTLFAKKSARAGIKTFIGIDLQMPEFIKSSGAVFMGADAVTETYFVNKLGSMAAVKYAAELWGVLPPTIL